MERLLITLLVRLGVISSVASIVIRYRPFRRALLRETRSFREQFHFALWFAGVFGVLEAFRIGIAGFDAVDLGLEGSFLAGLLGGYAPGLIAGFLIAVPGMAGASEYLGLPLTEAKTQLVEALERTMITAALDRAAGNISEAARQLGLHRQSLQQKMTQWKIRK